LVTGEHCPGFAIEQISPEAFSTFAEKHGTSEEVGRIATVLDDDADHRVKPEIIKIYGLIAGGDRLCAATCLTFATNQNGIGRACKLDSIVVHKELRRRGLAGVVVTEGLAAAVEDADLNVTRIFSYAVHPATVRLLKRLGFTDPPLRGAPLCSVDVPAEQHSDFARLCHDRAANLSNHLRLQCALCKKNHRRAIRWCVPQSMQH